MIPKARVYDRWYFWKVGVIVRRNTRSVYVDWGNEVERYDLAHARQFLRPYKKGLAPRS